MALERLVQRRTGRVGAFTPAISAMAAIAGAVLALFFAGPALAVPIDVFFDGPVFVDEPGDPSNFGMSLAQVTELLDNPQVYGQIALLQNLSVHTFSPLTVASQALQSIDPNPTKPTGNRATSQWTIRNAGIEDLDDDQYILFTHSDAYTTLGTLIDYPDPQIGITIDPEEGWVIVKATTETLGDFFYPALPLGALASGAEADLVVSYVVDTPLLDAPPGSMDFKLPELQVGRAFVPEPGTATLLAAGLVVLAARRARR